MGFFDLFKKEMAPAVPADIDIMAAPGAVCSVSAGELKAMADAPDPVFAQCMMGPGVVISPSEGVVYAPFDGTVSMLMKSMHAIGFVSNDGIELLVHIGVDTVRMKGDGFRALVQQGAEVEAGQALITFDRKKIAAAGYSDAVMMVVTNHDEYQAVVTAEPRAFIRAGEPVITVNR